MSTNSLLASLYSNSNSSNTTRSSSLFTKQYSFMSSANNQQKNRPSSVSKTIQNSSPNDLIKWTPLIKTVHKLSAKIKKDYFFFWCRMQALIKSKNKQKNHDKQNCIETFNTQTIKVQQKQQKLVENIPLIQNNKFQNDMNTQYKIPEYLPKQDKSQGINYTQVQKIQSQQIPQVPLSSQTKIIQNHQKIQVLKEQPLNLKDEAQNLIKKTQQQKLRKEKETKISNFFISLSKLNYSISSATLLYSFKSLKRFSTKVNAIQKIYALEFYHSKKSHLFQVLRMLKKHSHQIMKSQILVNFLKSFIKKVKIQTVQHLYKKALEQKNLTKSKKQITQNQISQNNNVKKLLNLEHIKSDNHIEKEQQTPRFNIQDNITPNLKAQEVTRASNQVQKQNQVQKPKILPLKVNQAKKVTQFWFNSYFKASINMKTDKPIEKHFNKASNHERMKKLSRLYPEEPFLQLPDISEITLFDSVVKNNSTLFQKKRSQNKSINTSLVSSIKLYTQREKQTSLTSTDNYSKQYLPFSPRFDQNMIDSKGSQQLFRKASSCANITVIKNSSSQNLKSNPNTPGSSKKIIGLFPKKKSVQLFSKNSNHKNYQSKLQSAKSAVLKKFDLFTQVKTQQQKEHHKSKIISSHSKQTKRNQTNKKTQKDKNLQIKNPSPLNFSQSKKNSDSTKKLYHQGSSKVVQKFYDMSVKRNGTGSKKQISQNKKSNQNRILYEKNSSKTILNRNESSKQNQLSEFNTLSNKVISYEEFMRNIPGQKPITGRTPLKEVSENEPIFQTIQMTEQDFCSRDLNECYGSCSAQLPKGKNQSNQQKSKKLRSKIEKMELNTARKMKIQIQNMISQRKKNSIGILKF